jgi:transposase
MRSYSTTTSTKADGFRRVEVITGVGRRRRWSDEDKARIVAESLDPATTSSAVARRYGLRVSQLFSKRAGATSTTRFQAATTSADPEPAPVPWSAILRQMGLGQPQRLPAPPTTGSDTNGS